MDEEKKEAEVSEQPPVKGKIEFPLARIIIIGGIGILMIICIILIKVL